MPRRVYGNRGRGTLLAGTIVRSHHSQIGSMTTLASLVLPLCVAPALVLACARAGLAGRAGDGRAPARTGSRAVPLGRGLLDEEADGGGEADAGAVVAAVAGRCDVEGAGAIPGRAPPDGKPIYLEGQEPTIGPLARSRKLPKHPKFKSAAVPTNLYPQAPIRSNGKLFMAFGEKLFSCSATVIPSGTHKVILTAGHCIFNKKRGFADRVAFIPGLLRRSRGARLLGRRATSSRTASGCTRRTRSSITRPSRSPGPRARSARSSARAAWRSTPAAGTAS